MKLSRLVSVILLVTFFSLFYVYQQSEIFRAAYLCQKETVVFEELLDANAILRYNMEKNFSLVQLADALPKSYALEMPTSFRLVRMPVRGESLADSTHPPQGVLVRLLRVKRQAEAKTTSAP